MSTRPATSPYTHKIASLCELRDAAGRYLLLRRSKAPNLGLCSPIGGKLDTAAGESPLRCAQREIEEEAGIIVPAPRLALVGIITEHGYDGATNWMMFWYRVRGAVEVAERTIREGDLIWRAWEEFDGLALPETDRRIIWPLVRAHAAEGAFFNVHIECEGSTPVGRVEESRGGL